ncbi:hypothetical protein NPS01_16670 [Nocardioides psychrotolerans]|uniref:Uncharacterized protein n=1 Tax=Nocardioides psychrotolerans TaxID=1005945 RepID=A0A1I3IHG8_9ACTN|nr:hypothetical protein [Nocardioides psychrotolerans]GEP38004.1 hypothetical protein NPS01_16670 [Nocardioides psychrotolerans]SFI47372.1 hypothetical protein SAMN05216561_10918 [Nocardioides psychrotolerans]
MDAVMSLILPLVEKGPEPEDVVAGWTAFGIFGLLILAMVILGFSLTKHLKKAASNQEDGLFGAPAEKPEPSSTEHTG